MARVQWSNLVKKIPKTEECNAKVKAIQESIDKLKARVDELKEEEKQRKAKGRGETTKASIQDKAGNQDEVMQKLSRLRRGRSAAPILFVDSVKFHFRCFSNIQRKRNGA